MQQILLTGNLGKDAELKKLGTNDYAVFSIGCSRKNTKGESETTWYDCYKYGANEKLLPYLLKGTKVLIQGELTIKQTEKEGKTYVNKNVNVQQLELLGTKEQTTTAPPIATYSAPVPPPEGSDLPF